MNLDKKNVKLKTKKVIAGFQIMMIMIEATLIKCFSIQEKKIKG